MNKYKFSLQNVLNLRKTTEKEAMYALGVAQKKLSEEKEVLEELKNKKYGLEKSTKIKFGVQEMQSISLYKQYLDREIISQQMVIKNAKDELRALKKDLLNSHKEKKIMEVLHDRDYEVHKEKMRKESDKELDDFYSSRHNRI